MGVTAKLQPVPSMSIGSEEISPLEMASAYGVLAADGGRHPAYYVDKVLDPKGDVVFQHDESQAEQAVDPGVARMATQMLQGVVKSGTGKRAALGDRPVAGKTGTSQDNADAWFVGYTPQLVTAVWMGAPVGRIPMRNVGGINVTGGSYPAKVWHEFMQKALDGQEVLQFGEPPELAERKPARCLYLPYVECGYEKPKEVSFGPTTTTTVPDPADHDEHVHHDDDDRSRAHDHDVAPQPSGAFRTDELHRDELRPVQLVPAEQRADHRATADRRGAGRADPNGGGRRSFDHRERELPAAHAAGRRPSGHGRAVTAQSDLLALQRTDTRLDQLRHRRAHLPERADLQALDGALADLGGDLEELTSRQTDLSRSQSRLEDEVARIEARRAEVDRKMSAGTVPRGFRH